MDNLNSINNKELGYLRLLVDMKSESEDKNKNEDIDNSEVYKSLSKILETIHFKNIN